MIQAIKDLANAFVPSGKLIELVDITLVRDFFHLPQLLIYFHFARETSVCFIMSCSQSWWTHSLTHSVMKSKELRTCPGFLWVRIRKQSPPSAPLLCCFFLVQLTSTHFSRCRRSCLVQHLLWGVYCVYISSCRRWKGWVIILNEVTWLIEWCFISTEINSCCILLQVNSYMEEIWILDYLWGKNHILYIIFGASFKMSNN